jgi:HD-like signal output (HDOD) protein/predicted Ser/Thr protein kinase
MQIVQATSRPECDAADIVSLLTRDPVICGQVLKVINSSVYGFGRAVTSIERAVVLLGLNTVRSIVLTFSLPAMQMSTIPDKPFRDHCLSSVSGAIIARELTVRARKPFAEDDLVCGLLRDLGSLLLRHNFRDRYEELVRTRGQRPFGDLCRTEREVFGVDHAVLTAELLKRWNLPVELVEPIRYHHEPEKLSDAPPVFTERAALLAFVEALTNLDVVAQDPAELGRVLAYAEAKHGLGREGLIEFLQGVLPKVQTFAALLSLDVGQCPDFASVLSQGCTELAMLAVNSHSGRGGGLAATGLDLRALTPGAAPAESPALPLPAPVPTTAPLPPFRPEFVDQFPESGCELDGYRLLSVLGRGAMGVVFRGYEPGLDRHVAVKVMARELVYDENARQRFAREARSVAAVRHENVVSVYAVREAAGVTYLVMEFVDGESLDDRLDRDGPLPAPDLLRVAEQVAAGLAAAHTRKVIHRDVKPANILIERATGRAVLTDFGLARMDDGAKLSTDSCIIGTPLYMAPEQVHGLPLDPRADLFSLGSVLYTLAAGECPFDSATTFGVLTKVCEHAPPPLTDKRPDVPAWFGELVARLLAKSRDDRPESAADVARLIRLTREPISDKPKAGGWKRWLGL